MGRTEPQKIPSEATGEELPPYNPFEGVDEKEQPWYGRDDLIMTDEEFWNEVNTVAPPSDEELDLEDKIFGDFKFDDSDMARYNEIHSKRINSEPTEEVYERRRLGALKAEFEWYKNGCKGKQPKGVSNILLCSTMFCSDRGIEELSYKWREKHRKEKGNQIEEDDTDA